MLGIMRRLWGILARSSAILALLCAPVAAQGGPQLQARYGAVNADVAKLELLADGIVIATDVLAGSVACGAERCYRFPLGLRGSPITYTLRASNALGEVATSNGVVFRVPLAPIAPTLHVDVLVPSPTPTP